MSKFSHDYFPSSSFSNKGTGTTPLKRVRKTNSIKIDMSNSKIIDLTMDEIKPVINNNNIVGQKRPSEESKSGVDDVSPSPVKKEKIDYSQYNAETFFIEQSSHPILFISMLGHMVNKKTEGDTTIVEYEKATVWYKGNVIHRTDGPAVKSRENITLFNEYTNGNSVSGFELWYQDGLLHRQEGPAIRLDGFFGGEEATTSRVADVLSMWANGGTIYREDDGPSIEYKSGVQKWTDAYGDVYRIELPSGDKRWYCREEGCCRGNLHRLNGPALVKPDGRQEWWFHGRRHRLDGGPAVIEKDGTQKWFFYGFLHREDGPAMITSKGSKHWFQGGYPFRKDDVHNVEEPSGDRKWADFNQKIYKFEGTNGRKRWFCQQNCCKGLDHRLDGPARECPNGKKEWFVHGKRHRTDGPAIVFPNMDKEWWENDKKVCQEIDGNKCWLKNDVPHREDAPAKILKDGGREWYLEGKRHRTYGPAVEYSNGNREWWQNDKKLSQEVDGVKCWFKNDLVHREDGPAKVLKDETREWYLDGKRHREDGPAIEYSNGDEEWWVNGLLHREGGPAIVHVDGTRMWYEHGVLHKERGFAVVHGDGKKEKWIKGIRMSDRSGILRVK